MRHTVKYFAVILIVAITTSITSAQEIQREEVVFRSGENVLSGTLVLPDSESNVPIVVFMGGMYEWGDLHPQRASFIEENLEAVFPKIGVGVFYYDPRGVGDSDGRWGRTTLNDFADDAIAAINFLSQRKEIDPSRIGIVGHGEDAWVAQIVGAMAPDLVHFTASLAGPTFDPTRQLVNEYHSEYVCEGENDEIAYEKAVQKAQSHQNWVSMIAITKKWRHMRMKIGFEPAEYLTRIEIPALFMFGENDGQVYPEWAIDELNTIFSDSLPSNFTVYEIPNANHFFHVVPPCFSYDDEVNIRKNYSFRFRELFTEWVLNNI
jgi:pimeloyl-ACP methyl ester carboxylesterase